MNNKEKIAFKRLLFSLVFIMVFEGLLRKLLPQAFGQFFFFIKDIICLLTLYYIAKVRLYSTVKVLYIRWGIILLAFVPLLVYTAALDIVLSVFAAKQYLLYIVVGLLIPLAFPPGDSENYNKFSFYFSLLVIPTTIVAIMQNALPATHWLNLSPEGKSLERFSAGGYLRVGSTFSFTGQYSWFLNILCAFLMKELFYPYLSKNSQRWIMTILLGSMFLIGVFITGGRTSVYGSGASVLIGFVFANLKAPKVTSGKGIIIIALLLSSLLVLRLAKPEFFAAYDKRAEGYDHRSNKTDEVEDRILNGFTDWNSWFWEQTPIVVLLGNGLGVMSNGSDKVSIYANVIRSTGFWTETDTATIAWEGGLYLMVLWYGFRFIIIGMCFQLWRKIKNYEYGIAASFLFAQVLINGLVGTIGMQPPVAIWWWLSVGCIIALHGFDNYKLALKRHNDKARLKDHILQV